MNSNLKGCFIFALGVTIGSAVSYYILKKKFEKDLKETTESIKTTYKKYYDERLNGIASEKLDKAVDNIMKHSKYIQNAETSERPATTLAEKEAPKPERRDYVDYTKYSQNTVQPQSAGPASDIFEISLEEYLRDNGFRKEVYEYWNEDDVLTDEKGLQVDIDVQVGPQPWRTIESGEADDIYVRNTVLQCDMEIQVREASYSEEIMGL